MSFNGAGQIFYVCPSFPFGIEGGMWDVIVLIPDHCFSLYFSYHSLVEIQLIGHKFGGHSFICTLQCILLPCDTICDSAVSHMTAHDIYANNAHDLCATSI